MSSSSEKHSAVDSDQLCLHDGHTFQLTSAEAATDSSAADLSQQEAPALHIIDRPVDAVQQPLAGHCAACHNAPMPGAHSIELQGLCTAHEHDDSPHQFALL